MCYNYDSASWVQCIQQSKNNSKPRELKQDIIKPIESIKRISRFLSML